MLSVSNISKAQAMNYYNDDGYYIKQGQKDLWQGKLRDELALGETVTTEQFNQLLAEHPKRAGFDLCFSAPKSVSIAAMLSPENIQNDMLAAHHKAVEETLKLVESREISARVTKDKITENIKTDNMIAAKFDHLVSRNHDPQLHTHSVIINKTKCGDKFYTIDNQNLYKNKILYGQIYRNSLAKQLLEKGYEIERTDIHKRFF